MSWRSHQWPEAAVDCWLQVGPLLDAADADAALASIAPDRGVPNRTFAGAEGPSERVLAPDVAGVRGITAFEQAVTMPDGPHRTLMLWFAVGRYLVVGALSGPAATVTWTWWADAAARQVAALPDTDER